MKLKDLFEFRAIPAIGPDVNRPTPVANIKTSPPLPDDYCEDRVWCEKGKKKMRLSDLSYEMEELTKPKDHFITNIEKDTIKNKDYRRVLFTATNAQLVLMSIEPKGEIGEEIHEHVDQFIRVESGNGQAVFNGKKKAISDGSAFIIPQGVRHNIVNTSNTKELKLYSVYSPPVHIKDTIQKTKEDEKEEHFDGDTDVQ